MAKPAGGPKTPQEGKKDFDEEDDWSRGLPAAAAVAFTPTALTWIDETFSTCLFKAQQFGLFCRNDHTFIKKCESQMLMALFALFVLCPK